MLILTDKNEYINTNNIVEITASLQGYKVNNNNYLALRGVANVKDIVSFQVNQYAVTLHDGTKHTINSYLTNCGVKHSNTVLAKSKRIIRGNCCNILADLFIPIKLTLGFKMLSKFKMAGNFIIEPNIKRLINTKRLVANQR